MINLRDGDEMCANKGQTNLERIFDSLLENCSQKQAWIIMSSVAMLQHEIDACRGNFALINLPRLSPVFSCNYLSPSRRNVYLETETLSSFSRKLASESLKKLSKTLHQLGNSHWEESWTVIRFCHTPNIVGGKSTLCCVYSPFSGSPSLSPSLTRRHRYTWVHNLIWWQSLSCNF